MSGMPNADSLYCVMHNRRRSKYPLPQPGERFGRWVVTENFLDDSGRWLTRCRCECGNEAVHTIAILKRGRTHSCGCLRAETAPERATKHGGTGTRLFKTWGGMKYRCENPHAVSYPHYGARGIKVCPEWQTFDAFREWSLANGYDETLQIDRIDNDGDYRPSNCRWVTCKSNLRNKSTTRLVTAFGETKAFSAWLEDSRCVVHNKSTLLQRLDLGWNPERAITEVVPKRAKSA